MSILRVARTPAVAVDPETTVMDAVRIMHLQNVGAVAVVDGNRLLGIFSERDLMLRVVLDERDPKSTDVGAVMTTDVVTITSQTRPDDAVATMWERKIRHLPIVAADGTVEGIVELRNLVHEQVEDLNRSIDTLHAYYSPDGLGG